jgi:hypothetical protein
MPTTPQVTNSEKTPLLFLGHGSPMNAIEENPFVEGFRQVANLFQKPRAIVCISAHWYTKGSFVTHDEHPRTIYDFYGFPPSLYDVRYPAKGHPVLATQVKALLHPTEVNLDTSWGLDMVAGQCSSTCTQTPASLSYNLVLTGQKRLPNITPWHNGWQTSEKKASL